VTLHPLTRDLLAWIAAGSRTHAEVREVWPSSCPRLTVWEDALDDGLVRVVRATGGARVVLTDAGRAALDAQRSTVAANTASVRAEVASA
jgi:hypothetical protein